MTFTGIVLTEGHKAGFLESASPVVLLVGGLALFIIGALLLFIVTRIPKGHDARDLLEIGGWAIGIIGLIGIYLGAFGAKFPPWK